MLLGALGLAAPPLTLIYPGIDCHARPVKFGSFKCNTEATICPHNSCWYACAQMIPIASFVRAAADGREPWPTTQDIWYSERVVDVDDDVTKWCLLPTRAWTLITRYVMSTHPRCDGLHSLSLPWT